MPIDLYTDFSESVVMSKINVATIGSVPIFLQAKKKAAPDEEVLKLMKGFSLGADPELFVQDPTGKIVCADMIPGTKDEPHVVQYGAIQRDGFAAEYNIDPCTTFEEWNRNHKAVQGQLRKYLPTGFKLVNKTSVRFSPEVFDAAPDCAKELGCSPDWDAWTGELNQPPKLLSDPLLRTIGGHIHFGWGSGMDPTDIQHRMNCFDLVKQLDFFLAAWSLKHDQDTERRKLYGKAGACRIKSYGVEYRVLSSFWVLSKQLRLAVWNRSVQAVNAMNKFYVPEQVTQAYISLAKKRINSGQYAPDLERALVFPLTQIHHPSYNL